MLKLSQTQQCQQYSSTYWTVLLYTSHWLSVTIQFLDELKDKSQVGQAKESTEQSATVESPSITQKEVNNTSLK